MKSIFTFFLVLSIFQFEVGAQTKTNEHTFGGSGQDLAAFILPLADGNYLLGGSSGSPISGNKTVANYGIEDYWVIKIDQNANEIWQNNYGGSKLNSLVDAIELDNGNIILAGNSNADSTGTKSSNNYGNDDIWLVCIDSLGNQLWDKSFGGSDIDRVNQIVKISNGNLLLVGPSLSGISGNKTSPNLGGMDIWAITIDINGNKINEFVLGGNDYETHPNVLEINQKLYFAAGSSSSVSGSKTKPNYGYENLWIVKTDLNGNVLNDEVFGGTGIGSFESRPTISNWNNKLTISINSNSEIGGTKTNGNFGMIDIWVAIIDTNLIQVLDKSFGGNDNELYPKHYISNNNDLIIGSSSWSSNSSGNKTSELFGRVDSWLISLSPDLTENWQFTLGGIDNESMNGLVSPENQKLLILNSSDSPISGNKTKQSLGGFDYWLVEMDIPLTVFEPKTQSLSINLFPNPAINTLSVLPNEMLKESYAISLFDALGKQVLKQNLSTANETLDVSHLPTGIYVVNISSENKVFQTKIIKE